MDAFLINIITGLQNSMEFWGLSFLMFALSLAAVLVCRRFFGYAGLISFNCLAIILANILVLKLTYMPLVNEHVALGTIIFSMTLLVGDLIVEDYGMKRASKSVWMTFVMQLFFMLLMVVGLSYPLLESNSELAAFSNTNHGAMMHIFAPSLRIFIAGMVAFIVSQFINAHLFNFLEIVFKAKVMLRYYVSIFISTLADLAVFSSIAWKIFNPVYMTWTDVFWTYVFTSLVIRIIGTFFTSFSMKMFDKVSRPSKSVKEL